MPPHPQRHRPQAAPGFFCGPCGNFFPGNPCDGHTLKETLEQAANLTGQRPAPAVVGRGHHKDKTRALISGARCGLTPELTADLRRRSAIAAETGHVKADGRLSRCHSMLGMTRR